MIRQWAQRRAGAIVLTIVALLGSPSLTGGLISDDVFLVPNAGNPVATFWTGGLFHLGGETSAVRARSLDMYRPLALSTFSVNHALGGEHPFGYHVVNWALHLMVTALVFGLLQHLIDRRAAVLGSLVFGLHPAAAEAFLWISGRFDLLMALFLVATWRLLERERIAAAFICALGACLSKEPAILGLAALAVRPRWPGEPITVPPLRLRPPRALLALGMAGALALTARLMALGGLRADASRPLMAYLRNWTAPWLAEALATMALPLGPSFIEPGEAYNRLSVTENGLRAIALVLLVLVSAIGWRRRPAWLWGLGAALALLGPAVLTLTIGKGRYLYAPLIFLLPGALDLLRTAGAWMAARTSRAHVLGPALAGVYLLCNAGQLLDASATFHSERAIWKTIADERPDLSSGPGLEGLDLLSADLDRAAPLLEKAHALAPIDLRWLDGLAILAFRRSDYSRCEALNRRGAQLAGDDVRFAFGRALCLRGLGDRAGAIAETARGLGLQPGHKGLRVLRDELR